MGNLSIDMYTSFHLVLMAMVFAFPRREHARQDGSLRYDSQTRRHWIPQPAAGRIHVREYTKSNQCSY